MARQELSTRFPVPDARYTAKTIHGKLAVQPASFDFTYTTPAPFCKADKIEKGKCTVQLNFIDGKPVLRLCNAKNQPGRTIPLTDATAARRIAKAACSSFNANKAFPELFTDTTDEDVEYDAASELRGLGLAKRSKRGRSSAAHERSEMLWAAVARARTPAERARATEAAEAHDARLSGIGAISTRRGTSMLKRASFGQAEPSYSYYTDVNDRTHVDRMVDHTGGPDAGSPERRKIIPDLYRAYTAHAKAVAKRDRAAIRHAEEEWLRAQRAFNLANDPNYYAQLAGAGKPRMMTLSLAGSHRPTKARGTKLKWCVYTKTKSGARKLSCHKLKRTAQAAAKKRKGATVRKGM